LVKVKADEEESSVHWRRRRTIRCKDRALMQSHTSESEIDIARTGRFDLESQIKRQSLSADHAPAEGHCQAAASF
jgi:hypothetical protein